ncbi:MAG: flavin reductase family protein [Enterococcus sp.]|nr:flavin reductase family protein [Enterococcus sp.]MBP7952946.1 flavin reductase family protein [Enterococcus sp.]
MKEIIPATLTQQENYKLLIGSIIPRPVALVTTQSAQGIVNVAPFSFFNIVSSNPPVVSLSVQRKNGIEKDTARNLREQGEGVIHILDEENVFEANETAANLAPEESELSVAKLTLVPSSKVLTPGLQEAKVRFEVSVLERIDIKKEEMVTADFFLLQIENYVIAEEVYEDGKINPHKLAPVSRLAGQDYSKLGEIFSLARPK